MAKAPALSWYPGFAAYTGWSCWKWINTILSLHLLRYSRTYLNILWGATSGQNSNQERAGISPLPVTIQAACSNTCRQIRGTELPRKLSFREMPIPHQTSVTEPRLNIQLQNKQKLLLLLWVQMGTYKELRSINMQKKNPEQFGMSGEQHTRECKPSLAQFHSIKLFLGLIQPGFEDHQAYPFQQSIPILKLESETNFRQILEGKGNLRALSKNRTRVRTILRILKCALLLL